MIRIGEESGRLEEMLFRVADAYEREVHQSIQRLMAILIPLTFGMALLIGGIIVSISCRCSASISSPSSVPEARCR